MLSPLRDFRFSPPELSPAGICYKFTKSLPLRKNFTNHSQLLPHETKKYEKTAHKICRFGNYPLTLHRFSEIGV